MRIYSERWHAFRLRTRVLCWGLGSCVVLLGAYLTLARPVIQQRLLLESTRSQSASARAALWASEAHPHPVPAESVLPVMLPFSPLDFQTGGVRLVHWLPGEKGGELTLNADWAQIPPLFERLTHCGMGVSSFSVMPEGARLQLIVQVESQNAN
ncbi:HofO family protein [Lelliottia wanjuensis]|uniref:HofO n=1 Tax=Lelliottia wanjuensis TaxID=3050585 RepID=A0AAP4D5R1_9ENTR|nr:MULTISPECIES: HofO [unclassified Lelliottia]MDK9363872.1 HofO [Lelliottia sp. V106_12]MDK9615714.1 HofO [Lelliottia sp. V106_9]